MTEHERIIADIGKRGAHAYGRNEYIKILKGLYVSPAKTIQAMCYSCCAYYEDEKADCGVLTCPLYGWMPYGKGKDERQKRTTSESTKKAMADGRARKSLAKQNDSQFEI